MFEHGELHTEAYNDSEDKEEDEEFERSQASNTATWPVKKENEEHIQNRNGTACYQRQFEEQIKSNRCTNDFRDVRSYDGDLREEIKDDVEPPWRMQFNHLCKIEARNGSQFDAQALQEYRKYGGNEGDV